MRITNEVLYTEIKHINKDIAETKEFIKEVKNNNINQWKQINRNAQGLSGLKAVSGIISGFVSLIIAGVIAYFGVKHQ